MFEWDCTGDEDLHFPLILGEKTPIILNREIHQPRNYITNVNNAHKWLMACQWHHFLLVANPRQVPQGIVYAKSRYTKA